MANNQKQEELNRLKQDGKINQENFDEQNIESVKNVVEGKKTIETVEQFIDLDTVVEAAMENSTYSNMLEPCILEGIDISKRLKKYFEDNKVKPLELEDRIQEEVDRIRRSINKASNNLFFNESGKIDVSRSIEKAQIYGVKVANYVSIVNDENINEIKSESIEEPYLINGIDIYQEIVSKDEKFYEALQNDFEERLSELDSKYDIKEAFAQSEEKDSNVNKDFENKLLNIRNMYNKIPIGETTKERNENLLKIFYVYRELENLNLKELKGLPEAAKKEIDAYMEGLRSLFKDRFSGIASIGIEDVTETDLIKSLRISDDKTISEIKSEVEKGLLQETDDKISFKDISEDIRSKVATRDKIRRAKLFISLTSNDFQRNKVEYNKFFNNVDIDLMDQRILSKVNENMSNVIDEANRELEQDNVMPIYADIIKRIYAEKKFSEFKVVDDISDKKALAKEFITILNAIDVVCKKDPYLEIGNAFEKDMEHRKKAMEIIENVFPNSVMHSNILREGMNSSLDMQNLLADFKSRYKIFSVVQKIDNPEEFLAYADRYSVVMQKSKLTTAITLENSEDAKEINRILDDKEILKEASEKTKLQEKRVIKEKRLSNLTSDILSFLDKKEKNIMSVDDEIKLVENLSIVLKEYSDESNYRQIALYRIAKVELAKFLPGAYDVRGTFCDEKLDSEYIKFLSKKGINIEEGKQPLKEAVARLDEDIEKKYLSEKITKNPKALAEQMSEMNMEKILTVERVRNQEKVLKFMKFIRRASQKDGTGLSDEYINSIEEKAKENIGALLANDEKGKESAEDIFKKVDSSEFDDVMYYSMLRNVRIAYTDKNKINLARKYSKTERIDNNDDIKQILSMYLGTKNDVKNSTVNKTLGYGRQVGVFNLMRKISPNLVKGNIVNTELLLDLYNNSFGTNISDINEAYEVEENKLLEEIVENLHSEIRDNKDYRFHHDSCLWLITADEFAIKCDLQTIKSKEEHEKIRKSLTLIHSTQALLEKKNEMGLTKAEEALLIQGAVAIIGNTKNKEKVNPIFELTDTEIKYNELREKAILIAAENLEMFFPNIKLEDGSIDIEELEKRYEEYLVNQKLPIPNEKDKTISIIEATVLKLDEEKEAIIGPKPRLNLEHMMQITIDEIDETLQEWQNFKIGDGEMHILEDKMEDMVVGVSDKDIGNPTSKTDAIMEKVIQEM